MRIPVIAIVLTVLSSVVCLAQDPPASAGEQVKLPALTWQGTGCKGEELAVLMGCPFDSASPFVMRVRLEKGLRLPSHSYPIDIGVTVIDGALEVTFLEGEKKRTVTLKAGDFFKIPAYASHTAYVLEKTELQDNGVGPVFTTWEDEKCKPGPKPDPLVPLCARGR